MKRKGYLFKSHTADVKLVAHGKTLEEAFKNAVLAMFDTSAYIMAVSKMGAKARLLTVKDKAANLEDLLWVTLQDALSVADSNSVYGYAVKSLKISGSDGSYSVILQFFARPQDPKYSVIYVKGVSRYELKVTKKGKECRVSAVLDV